MADLGELKVKIGADLANLESALNKVKADLGQIDGEAQKTAGGLSDIESILGAIGVTKGIEMIWGQLQACTEAAIEFESALAGVAKTSDLSDAELSEYAQAIKDMAEDIPLTTTELLGISEAAGQLGISGKENLLVFTDVMAKLGTATNMTSDEAATMLAQFANITSMDSANYENLASTIVALGNSSATTEKQITEMAQGMAAAGANAGMSEAEILALAAAASSVGIEAAAGSTSWSQLIAKIQTAVETGDDLEAWAEVAGMSANEFKTAFQTNAAGALDLFITGLKRSSDEGKSMISTLTSLGINEVRQQRLVQSLANAEGLLSKSLATANSSWSENNALNKEAQTRFQTTESKITMLNNKFSNFQTTIGDQLNPAFQMLLDIGNDLMDWANDFAEEHEALGPILAGLAVGATVYAGALIGQAAATKIAKLMQDDLNKSMLANPVLLIITAIAALTVTLIAFAAQCHTTSDAMENTKDKMKDLKDSSKELSDSVEDMNSSFAKVEVVDRYAQIIDELGPKTNRTKDEELKLQYAIDQVNSSCEGLDLTLDDVSNGLSDVAKNSINAAKQQAKANAIMQKQEEIYSQIIETEMTMEEANHNVAASYDAVVQAGEQGLLPHLEELARAANDETLSMDERRAAITQYNSALATSSDAVKTYMADYDACLQVQEDGQVIIDELNGQLDATNSLLGETTTTLEENTDWYSQLTETEQGYVDTAVNASTQLSSSIEALKLRYAEIKAEKLEDLQALYKWDEGIKIADIDVTNAAANMVSSAETLRAYGDNVSWLAQNGIPNFEEICTAMNLTEEESMGLAQALRESPEDIPDVVAAYEDYSGALDETAGTLASKEPEIVGAMNDIGTAFTETVEGLELSEEAKGYVEDTLNGVIEGCEGMDAEVSAAMKNVVNNAISTLQSLSTTVPINVKVTGSTSSPAPTGTRVPKHDSGGFFRNPHLALIAEKRPEFVGASQDLQTFINSAVGNAFANIKAIPTADMHRSVGNAGNVTVNVPITVSKELSDYDIEQKATQITNIVSKKFAEMSGGRMS